MKNNKLIVYPMPRGIEPRKDFMVYLRKKGTDDWKETPCYEVSVDMHDVRKASMAYFDFTGVVEVKICFNVERYREIYRVDVRPKNRGIIPVYTKDEIYFELERPENLSIEVNKDRYHNLHLFAGEVPENEPDMHDENVLVLKGNLECPSIHGGDALTGKLKQMKAGRTLYFEQGVHYISECVMKIPSDTNVYISGGAVIIGSFVCDHVENIRIYGRGVIYQARFERYSSLRGVRISHSFNIQIEGISFINPPHYTVYIGGSEHIVLKNIKSFSCEGWSDGIDIMSSRHIWIDGIFMRNSDDCVAVYGHRWGYYGDTYDILVEHAVLWADVAHPVNIGCHGDYENGGDVIRDVAFKDIDVLEHHEPQKACMGCMAINAGDGNTVRNVRFENVRVEHIEHGKLLDVQIICGRYNPIPGKLIEDIHFKDIYYDGDEEEISEIKSLPGGKIRNIVISNLVVRGQKISEAKQGNIYVGENVRNLTFE